MLSILVIYWIFNNFSTEIKLLFNRFSGEEGSNSVNARMLQINASMNVINNNLMSVFFGYGTGSTSDHWFKAFYELGAIKHYKVHNSLIALLVENGLIGLFLYLFFHFLVFKNILYMKSYYKYSILGCFLTAFLYSQTAYIVYFLPYWLSLILISLHVKRINVMIRNNPINSMLEK